MSFERMKTPIPYPAHIHNDYRGKLGGSVGSIEDLVTFFIFWVILDFLSIILFILLKTNGIRITGDYFNQTHSLIIFLYTIGFLWIFCRKKETTIRNRLRIDSNLKFSPSIKYYFLALLMFVFIACGIVLTAKQKSVPDTVAFWGTYGRGLPGLMTIGAVQVAIFGPINNEIIYRGFIYPILKSRSGKWWGIGITSLLYALADTYRQSVWMLPFFLALGIFLNLIFEREKNLLWNIIFHSTYNLTVLVSLGVVA